MGVARILEGRRVSGTNGIDLAWLAGQFPDLTNLSPLSRGGQKLVLSADHSVDGAVVLKLIHPNQDAETTNRELLAIVQVSSPRVPRVLARGQISTPIGDCVWFREQRVQGQSVRAILGAGPMAAVDVLSLGLHVLETLAASEAVNIVHRDVKPDNLMRDANGDCWLLDFGLARHLSLTSLTVSAIPFGKMTVGYAPPEQSRNIKGDIDSRADLFATGVTLHECATGIHPFRHGSRDDLETLRKVDSLPLPALSLPVTRSQDLADLVSAMTQKRRDHRPASVREAYEWMCDICRAEGLC
jgi:eukaryotic-like serine/threonine-protein kinase